MIYYLKEIKLNNIKRNYKVIALLITIFIIVKYISGSFPREAVPPLKIRENTWLNNI